MNENFFSRIIESASVSGSKIFMVEHAGKTYTYNDLLNITSIFSEHLHNLGVEPGDRVAAQINKSPHGFLLYLAVLRVGGIFVPLNTAYTPKEVDYFLCDCKPAIFFCSAAKAVENKKAIDAHVRLGSVIFNDSGECATLLADVIHEELAPPVVRDGSDVAIIIYTSGTTGQPKGAMLTHANLTSNAQALTKAWMFDDSDVLLHALPIFHAHGLFISTHCVLLSGSKMIFLEKFDTTTVMENIPQSTVMMGVPTFYTRLLAAPGFDKELTRRMRLFISGSAPLLEESSQQFYERTGHVILERYGMTESAIITSNPYNLERKIGSVGLPIEGVQVRITAESGDSVAVGDVGSIEIKGPAVMKGYWNKPEKTAEEFTRDGWFKTGDLGRLDEEGYLYISGRGKDLVISGGYNVYPKEVELVIDAIPEVQESAVIGVPHPDFGEAVVAVVVPGEKSDTIAENVIAVCKENLAGYKVPKAVKVVAELPRNAMGKVLKAHLRAEHTSLFI
ncbi:AMP-binding protein [Marinobacterium iners]|uniref:Malonyl-CoA/methylmalonyl-CoA synthetase n=1 Tax=Marinobacterium iners DSM 11526 TaxID=1122198 RepID=A0A1H3XTR5_9GAMM|nr:AMP-binding protein [Marinobacterium iners]SEA02630.1 malonyl-CoA/methylmalonyl-CoA synthetase [Marinobacterium iners DSM 11526]